MENPFEILNQRLERVENLLLKIESCIGLNELIPVNSKVMDITQLATYLSLSKSCIYKYTFSRMIPHSKKGKKLYFEKELIDNWVLENKIRTMDELELEAIKYSLKKR